MQHGAGAAVLPDDGDGAGERVHHGAGAEVRGAVHDPLRAGVQRRRRGRPGVHHRGGAAVHHGERAGVRGDGGDQDGAAVPDLLRAAVLADAGAGACRGTI